MSRTNPDYWTDPAGLWAVAQRKLAWDESGCLLWTGHLITTGYAQIMSHGKGVLVHRLAVAVRDGQHPPADMTVDHTCHNDADCVGGLECKHRRCANPEHLEVVTSAENIRRAAQGERRVGRRPRGHRYFIKLEDGTEMCQRGHSIRSRADWYQGPSKARECRACKVARNRRSRARIRERQAA